MNVLISPDKFKGTLTAAQAAEAIGRGWRRSRPADHLELLPMSDGGDGFGEIIGRILGAERQETDTVDAAHRPVRAEWWWHEASRTCLVESARVIGLAQLPKGRFHPFELDTRGLGVVLSDCLRRGAESCLIGIGGSATNDAGFGMAQAMGWKFLDEQGQDLPGNWTELHRLASVVRPGADCGFKTVRVASDVQNPLLGPEGCSRIYGPQKGLTVNDFEIAERNLERLAAVVQQTMGHDFGAEPGAGAAGGLGFGLRCFLNGALEPGFDIFAHYAELSRRLESAELVVTGEGSIDHSTAMGKGVGQLAKVCGEHRVSCIGLAGVSSHPQETGRLFTEVHAMAPAFTSPAEAMNQPALWLERMAAQVAAKLRL